MPGVILFPLRRFINTGPGLINDPQSIPVTQFQFSGITRDSTGTPVASCTVKIYRTRDDYLLATTTSDANGKYQVVTGLSQLETYYIIAFLPGSPDKAGITDNNLVPV